MQIRTIAAKIRPAHVIGEDQNNVRPFGGNNIGAKLQKNESEYLVDSHNDVATVQAACLRLLRPFMETAAIIQPPWQR